MRLTPSVSPMDQGSVQARRPGSNFYLLIEASKVLPVGTSYAVFVGLGTTGVTLFDFIFFGQPFNPGKIVLIITLLLGVISLKLVTTNEGGRS